MRIPFNTDQRGRSDRRLVACERGGSPFGFAQGKPHPPRGSDFLRGGCGEPPRRSRVGRLGRWATLGLALALSASAGCEFLGQFFAWGFAPRHPMKQVKTEYRLEVDRLVIVPYAGTGILFEYPTASVEVARAVRNEIARHLGKRVKEVADPAYVVRWQESNLEWPNMTLEDIAGVFQADTVLYVELEQYTMIEERSANLFRGRVRARVQVIKAGPAGAVESEVPANPVYETTIETVFPEDRPVGVLEVSERKLRAAVTRIFARDVIRKFYKHEVQDEGGKR